MRKAILAVLAASWLAVTPAYAQTAKTRAPKPPAPQRIVIDDDEVITGGRGEPGGELILAPRPLQPGSLIRLRDSFVPELLKSADGV